jgi:protein phosphatase
MPIAVASGAESIPGRRESNEDALHRDAEHGLFVVADGTGGRGSGKVAADLACQTLAEDLTPIAPIGLEQSIDAAVARAHRKIRDRWSDPAHHGMATTVVVLAASMNRVHVAHVGDSRAYLCRRGKVTLLTRDHSLSNYLKDNPGKAPKVQRPGDTLVRALGLNEEAPKADHHTVELEAGDVVLACSDGVSSFIPEWALGAILSESASLGEDGAAKALVEAALAQGSMDNASAVVLRAHDSSSVDVATIGWLAFLEGPRQGQVVPVEGTIAIGRDPSSSIVVTDLEASDRHAEIRTHGRGFAIRDLGGKSGTFINDVRIEDVPLLDGDVIRVGSTKVVFKCHRPS